MDENRARDVVKALRNRGVDAHVLRAGVYEFGVAVSLGDGREAVWGADSSAGLEAQVIRDGALVGFVGVIEGSADFDDATVVDLIARADYHQPVVMAGAPHRAVTRPSPRRAGTLARLLHR